MRTERRWKWLSVVLVVLLGFAVAMPSAVADSTESVRQIVEQVRDVTTSTQRQTTAIHDKVDGIYEASQLVFDAVGQRGFSKNRLEPGECELIVPPPPDGWVRFATIVLYFNANQGSGPSDVIVHESSPFDSDGFLSIPHGEPQTLIRTVTEGWQQSICQDNIGASGVLLVEAQWEQVPVGQIDE